MNEKFYAVLCSGNHIDVTFKSLHPTLELAKNRVDFEVESANKFAAILPECRSVDYLVVEVPVVYVGRTTGKQ